MGSNLAGNFKKHTFASLFEIKEALTDTTVRFILNPLPHVRRHKTTEKMLNNYETVFIMTPVLSDEQAKETVSKYKKILVDNKCKVLNSEDWGLKKLAYQIQKKSTGYYFLMEFQGYSTVVAELELAFKRDERVLRFLTVALDKHAVAYNEKRRNKSKKKQEVAA